MAGDLRFDADWSVAFAFREQQTSFLPSCRIRPDDLFERQLYLESFSQVQPNKKLGILAQTGASADGKSDTIHKIFEKNIPTDKDQSFCIDEIAGKLYLFFRGTKKDRRGEFPFHLSISSVSFGEPDGFSHRRVTLSDNPGGMYKINFGDKTTTVIIWSNFFLHPKTGELLFVLTCRQADACFQLTGKLDLNGALTRTRTIEAQIFGKFEIGNFKNFGLPMPSIFRFINKGNLAIFNWWRRYRAQKLAPNDKSARRLLMQTFSVDGGQFKLEQSLFCDHIDLFKKIEAIGNKSRTGPVASGQIFKYAVFTCSFEGVFLVKNLHRWIEAGLCESNTKHCFLSFKTPNLFRQIHREDEYVSVENILGSTLYYLVFDVHNRQGTLHRLELGNHFKDYRTCAYCRVQETNKRHNAKGKRIANFKVCRDCKKVNLHHQWWKFPCHFCSNKCMKKGWKEHKKQHRVAD